MYYKFIISLMCCLFLATAGCSEEVVPEGDDDVEETPVPTPTPTATPETGPEDLDLDGYGADRDCDDTNAAINPGAPELCDGVDNNCNSQTDEGFTMASYYPDADQDGYGDSTQAVQDCKAPEGYLSVGGDCDDANASINPTTSELVCNGLDEDCSGMTNDHPDLDYDAVDICEPGVADADDKAPDCNDAKRNVHPGAI